jgi:hypothetical protein
MRFCNKPHKVEQHTQLKIISTRKNNTRPARSGLASRKYENREQREKSNSLAP